MKLEHYRRVARDTYTLEESELREAIADYLEKHAGVRPNMSNATMTGFNVPQVKTGATHGTLNLKGINELSVTVDVS